MFSRRMAPTQLRAEASDAADALERLADRLVQAVDLAAQTPGGSYRPLPEELSREILDAACPVQKRLLAQLANKWIGTEVLAALCGRDLGWTVAELETLLSPSIPSKTPYCLLTLLQPLQRHRERGGSLSAGLESVLRTRYEGLRSEKGSYSRRLRLKIARILEEQSTCRPDAGESWADAALADLDSMQKDHRSRWESLLAHAVTAESPKPASVWRRTARNRLDAVGRNEFRARTLLWVARVRPPCLRTVQHVWGRQAWESQQSAASERNITLLKGLAWMCAELNDAETARALGKLAVTTLKKLPQIGPWATRAANGAVWALSEIDCPDAVAELVRLRTKVTSRTVLAQIEKALQAAAARAGLGREDLEDLSVPWFGFDDAGTRRESFTGCSATARAGPRGEFTVQWKDDSGRTLKAPTARAAAGAGPELKRFRSELDAAARALTAQKSRFDSFALQDRSWTLDAWQTRFLHHPLLRSITLRLIWRLSDDEHQADGIWSESRGAFVDAQGHPVKWPGPDTEVRQWHPIGSSTEQVVQWRRYLQEYEIVQPFKQAHREIYILTDAERRTATYSNRFAGHILKQHQMNNLAALRGWKNKLRLMVDDQYPPATRDLPCYGLRAEFWIEGAGDTHGTDTTEAGTYLYLNTDQVRFYRRDAAQNYAHASGGGYGTTAWNENTRAEAEPLILEQVPALVFSEIMRDVDLFVGVSSVGNDPAWQDGGPHGECRDYWSDYSFGSLSATSQTRRAVLEDLLPRLKIASRCALTDRFLAVRGDLRTYKIHLGSGNILMSPNDQYLCIVPDRRSASRAEGTKFLPFEGDERLSHILSKAFLLADDRRITDPSITAQIGQA